MFISMDHQNPQTINIFPLILPFAYMVGCQDAVRLCSWLAMCVYMCVCINSWWCLRFFLEGHNWDFPAADVGAAAAATAAIATTTAAAMKPRVILCAVLQWNAGHMSCWAREETAQGQWGIWKTADDCDDGGAVAAAADKKKSFSLGNEKSLMIFKGYYCCRLFLFLFFFKYLVVYESSTIYINDL